MTRLEAEKIEINHLLFLNKTVNLYRVSEMKEKIQYSYLFNAVASTIINVSGKVCFVIKHLVMYWASFVKSSISLNSINFRRKIFVLWFLSP